MDVIHLFLEMLIYITELRDRNGVLIKYHLTMIQSVQNTFVAASIADLSGHQMSLAVYLAAAKRHLHGMFS